MAKVYLISEAAEKFFPNPKPNSLNDLLKIKLKTTMKAMICKGNCSNTIQ